MLRKGVIIWSNAYRIFTLLAAPIHLQQQNHDNESTFFCLSFQHNIIRIFDPR